MNLKQKLNINYPKNFKKLKKDRSNLAIRIQYILSKYINEILPKTSLKSFYKG